MREQKKEPPAGMYFIIWKGEYKRVKRDVVKIKFHHESQGVKSVTLKKTERLN